MTTQEPNLSELTPFSDELDNFDHIPQLTELTQHGGTPGYTYAQVCSHHLTKARREGWSLVNRDAYVIVGTKGHADMILMVKGEPNTLLSPLAGLRQCQVDLEVEILTGLMVSKEQKAELSAKPQAPAKPPADIKVTPSQK